MENNITIKDIKYVCYALLIMSVVGAQLYLKYPLLPLRILFLGAYWVCSLPLLNCFVKIHKPSFSEGWPLYLYLIWMVFCTIRGFFMPQPMDFWEFSSVYIIATLTIYSVTFLGSSLFFMDIICLFKRWLIPLCLYLVVSVTLFRHFGFFVTILQLFLLLITLFNKRNIIIILVLSGITILFATMGEDMNRSTILKYSIAALLGLIPSFRYLFTNKVLNIIRVLCFILPIFLMYDAIYNDSNIFEISAERNEGDDLYTDSRSTVYEEAIISANANGYILFGRTPFRGYDSAMETWRTGKPERAAEASMVNIFTWYGLVGLILYTILFWYITGKGINNSNNIYIQTIALYLAFRYLMGWIEDYNNFNATNITLWLMMSVCLLPDYRYMTNDEFEENFNFLNM